MLAVVAFFQCRDVKDDGWYIALESISNNKLVVEIERCDLDEKNKTVNVE